jgi:hypothetical protein
LYMLFYWTASSRQPMAMPTTMSLLLLNACIIHDNEIECLFAAIVLQET